MDGKGFSTTGTWGSSTVHYEAVEDILKTVRDFNAEQRRADELLARSIQELLFRNPNTNVSGWAYIFGVAVEHLQEVLRGDATPSQALWTGVRNYVERNRRDNRPPEGGTPPLCVTVAG